MRFLHWVKEECIIIFPAVVYFCIALNLVYFTQNLALREGGIHYSNYLTVTLAGVIMGKVLIIINSFPFIDLFPKKPLIYNILWKSFFYNFILFLVRLLDMYIELRLKFHNYDKVFHQIRVELDSPMFWCAQMWLILVFIIFIVFTEIFNRVGKHKMMHMLFGTEYKND